MRPDMDNYEDIDDGKPAANSRAMSWMVLAVAVGGFAALAYYAYHSGTQAPADGDTLVVEADDAPIKQAPENPEGEQFPNKDKTIYDVIAPDADKSVEKLLAEPERPVAAANVEDSEDNIPVAATPPATIKAIAKTEANGTVAATTTFVAPEAAVEEALPVTPAPKAPAVVKLVEKPAEKPVAVPTPAAAPVAAPKEKSYAAPQMVNEKKATEPKVAETKPAPKAKAVAEKPAAKPAAGGAYMVQLGAFKSESEAQANWKKISGKYSDVLSGNAIIVKADVNGGTFYRLRANGFNSAEAAKAACAKLTAKGQACFPAGK